MYYLLVFFYDLIKNNVIFIILHFIGRHRVSPFHSSILEPYLYLKTTNSILVMRFISNYLMIIDNQMYYVKKNIIIYGLIV